MAIDVSVVIPAYKAADFIDRAISSALSQTGVTVEVIVVDDACPLQTAAAVEDRYRGNPAVRVFRQPVNGGPSAARNAGFRKAEGEWIAILDADDAYAEGRLERMVRQGRDMGADVVADNVRLYNEPKDQLSEGRVRDIMVPTFIDLRHFLAHAHPETGQLDYGLLKPMFRRAFVETMPELYSETLRHSEDFKLYFDMIAHGARFLMVPEPGYHWTLRNSGNSQTRANYEEVAQTTRSMASLPAAVADPVIIDLLEKRARALIRLGERRAYVAAINNRKYLTGLLLWLRHPHLTDQVLKSLNRRLGKRGRAVG